jgi:dCTP deaminase
MKCFFCNTRIKRGSKCSNCQLSQEKRTFVDWEIKKLLKEDYIGFKPLLNISKQLGAASLDLRLDTKFRQFKIMMRDSIDPTGKVPKEYYEEYFLDIDKEQGYILHPREFVLAQSFEYVSLPNCIYAKLDGRSSLARMGITVHSTAGEIDQGFKGHITLELSNNGKVPVKLRPLQRVGRLSFHLTEPVETPYCGKFQFQSSIKPPEPDNYFFLG